jgi:hypothetical protein
MGRYDPRRLAPVAELVDAADSKSVGGDIVLVRVRPGAPRISFLQSVTGSLPIRLLYDPCTFNNDGHFCKLT